MVYTLLLMYGFTNYKNTSVIKKKRRYLCNYDFEYFPGRAYPDTKLENQHMNRPHSTVYNLKPWQSGKSPELF